MQVKICKKTLLALVLVLLLASAAMAAPAPKSASALTGGKSQGGDGFSVEATYVTTKEGTVLTKSNYRSGKGILLSVCHTVIADSDMTIKVDSTGSDLVDGTGNRFSLNDTFYSSIQFGNAGYRSATRDYEKKFSYESEITEGVPTPIILTYFIEEGKYELTPTYPRAYIIINGKKWESRDVPSKR